MKKFSKLVCFIICIAATFPLLTACFGNSLTYSGSTLAAAKVGAAYTQSVAVATGAGEDVNVTYALKEGSNLPLGLLLRPDGEVSGTPRAKADSVSFTVVASAEGYNSAEAQFSLKVNEGTLVYAGKDDLRAATGKATEISVASATGGNAITYAIKEGSGDLPAGFTMSADGKITGTPTAPVGTAATFTVIASATDCTSAEAEFTLTVALPWLEYADDTMPNGRVGEYYTQSVATASGAISITYALKPDSNLPEGLTINSAGLIMGTPSAQVTRATFIIVASATGFTSGEATFSLTIAAASSGNADEGIITYTGKAITGAYVAEAYTAIRVVGTATTDNRQTATYALTAGDLPDGLTLLPNGTITGTPTTIGTAAFTVTASAQGCAPVAAEFTLTVGAPKVKFETRTIPLATKGDAYSHSVADASVVDGGNPSFSYTVKAGSDLPNGLTMNAAGLVSGTPTVIAKNIRFIVVVTAIGYTTAEAEIFMTIQDKIHTGVTLFEAEYWNLTGLTGGGYSGSASEEYIIRDGTNAGARGGVLAFTHSAMLFKVPITSSAAASGASFYICLDSEIGNITLNNSVFDIRINGVSIPYTISITDTGTNTFKKFTRYTVSTNISLKQGENIIELEILENLLMGNARTGGPGIDYIEFGNLGTASLSWRPKTINLLSEGEYE